MRADNNFDARKIASTKNKILFAIAFVCVVALALWSPSLRVFAANHPGIIGVLVAVTGELYFDWKEERGKHARWKKFFMALLVVSLSYELYEAAETDKKAADAITLAVKANEHVEELRAENARLKLGVTDLNKATAPREIPASLPKELSEELKTNGVTLRLVTSSEDEKNSVADDFVLSVLGIWHKTPSSLLKYHIRLFE